MMPAYNLIAFPSRPSYQRKQKFDRGPVVHRTRRMKGMSNLKWREDFAVSLVTAVAALFCCYQLCYYETGKGDYDPV